VRLETARLSIRPLAHDDLDSWAEFLGDPDALRLVHFPEPHDRAFAADLLEKAIAKARGNVAMYTVTVRASGETAGFVGYAPRALDWGPEVELGWLLLSSLHGRGYATEAARAIRPLLPGRVISLIRVENERSINVARKLGMTLERNIEFAGYPTHVYASEAPPWRRATEVVRTETSAHRHSAALARRLTYRRPKSNTKCARHDSNMRPLPIGTAQREALQEPSRSPPGRSGAA
jgi:RimJ/RimL family protein N-acetyltransferase